MRKTSLNNTLKMTLKNILKTTTLMLGIAVTLAACVQTDATYRRDSSDRMYGSLESRLSLKNQKLGNPIFVRIFKEEKELELWMQNKRGKFERFGVYSICKYSGQLGPKFYEGDLQAPEGFYAVSKNSMKPDSQYHRAFNLGFPNAFDQAHNRTGRHLMVHGDCRSVGCYAMTDPQIEEIFKLAEAALKNGQAFFRVQALPFRMTDERMARALHHRHNDFWRQLKAGYDAFEKSKIPPNVDVVNGRYVVR